MDQNTVIASKKSGTLKLSARVDNFRTVKTASGLAMAVFTFGDVPAKCFGNVVNQVAVWEGTGKSILVVGRYDDHGRAVEFVVESVLEVAALNNGNDATPAYEAAYVNDPVYAELSAESPELMEPTPRLPMDLEMRLYKEWCDLNS